MAESSKFNVVNSSRVLLATWKNPGISRIEISKELDLNRSTITRIIRQLVDKGYIIDGSKRHRDTVGRRPVGLSINTELGVILGIEIQTQRFEAVVINFVGEVIQKESTTFDPEVDSIKSAIVTFITGIKKDLEKSNTRILLLGIAVSGLVDPYLGIIHHSNPMNITDPVPFAKELEDVFQLPVLLENDANCCSWGELVYRKDKQHENFLTVLGEFRSTNIKNLRETTISIGYGLVIDSKVYYGDNFSSGEFKSVDWVSGRVTQFSTPNDISSNILENKEELMKVFHELARSMAIVINICSFDRIVLASEIAEYKEFLEPFIIDNVIHNWLYAHVRPKSITVDVSPLGKHSVAYGAASHALMRIFSIPDVVNGAHILRGTILLDKLTCRS